MAKKVSLTITVDTDGETIHVTPEGTEGTECIGLMSFLDTADSLTTEETVKLPEYKNKKVQIVGTQNVSANN